MLVVAEAEHLEHVSVLRLQVTLFIQADDGVGQLCVEVRPEVLGYELLHFVPQAVEIARTLELIEDTQELRVLLAELQPQELLLGAVALERVKEDPQEGLLELLCVLARGSRVALRGWQVRPLLLLSHRLLRKLLETLHDLVDAERGRTPAYCQAEDLEVALVLHAPLVSYHGVLFV